MRKVYFKIQGLHLKVYFLNMVTWRLTFLPTSIYHVTYQFCNLQKIRLFYEPMMEWLNNSYFFKCKHHKHKTPLNFFDKVVVHWEGNLTFLMTNYLSRYLTGAQVFSLSVNCNCHVTLQSSPILKCTSGHVSVLSVDSQVQSSLFLHTTMRNCW